MSIDVEAVRKAAGSTRDPEIRRSLTELGLLDEVQIEEGQVTVQFHLTSPLCPTKFATSIGQEIRRRVEAIPRCYVVSGCAPRSLFARQNSRAYQREEEMHEDVKRNYCA